MKSTRKNQRKKRPKKQRVPNHMTPPTFKAQPIQRKMVRVNVGGGPLGSGQTDFLTPQQLAGILGITALTATTSTFIGNQFRLVKAEMWGTTAVGATCTIGLKWSDNPLAASIGIANPPVGVEDTSISPDVAAHVVLRPPKNSYADNWFGVNATPLLLGVFTNVAAATGTLDLHFEYIYDDIGLIAAGPTIVGGIAGTNYHKSATGSAALTYTVVPPLNSI